MNVLFIISRFLDGGIDTVLVEMLQTLAADSRYSITLAITLRMGDLEVYTSRLPKNIDVHHLISSPLLCQTKVRRFNHESSRAEIAVDEAILTPIRRRIVSHKLRKLIALNDVVIDFDACHTAFLKNCPKPTYAWVHFSLEKLLEQNAARTMRIAKRMEAYDKIVLICRAMKEEADRLFPHLREKTVVVYNALDPDHLRKRAAEPIDCKFPFILAVERLEETQKDLHTLLKAYSLSDIKEHLVIVGKGKDEEELKSYAKALGLTVSDGTDDNAKVHFLGFQSNPHAWMARASLLVHSAKFEGLPTVLIESLILGVPTIATDCPTGPDEILDDGKAGILTPVGDAQGMADAIQRMLHDNTLRDNILAHAKEHCKNFTKEEIKRQLDELLL